MNNINNINCKKIDRESKCHHQLVKDVRVFLWFKGRPYCKLYLQSEERIDLEGNVSYDEECKFQEEYLRKK